MERVSRIGAIGFVAFAGVFGYLVAERVDRVTVAMLGGMLIGLLVTTPILLAVGFVVLRLQRRNDALISSREHFFAPMPQSPPQYWNAPTPMSFQPEPAMKFGGAADHAAGPAFQLPPQRKFYVIGEDGGMTEAY